MCGECTSHPPQSIPSAIVLTLDMDERKPVCVCVHGHACVRACVICVRMCACVCYRTRESHRQSDEHWNRFKGNVEETSERCGGAHMGFSERSRQFR